MNHVLQHHRNAALHALVVWYETQNPTHHLSFIELQTLHALAMHPRFTHKELSYLSGNRLTHSMAHTRQALLYLSTAADAFMTQHKNQYAYRSRHQAHTNHWETEGIPSIEILSTAAHLLIKKHITNVSTDQYHNWRIPLFDYAKIASLKSWTKEGIPTLEVLSSNDFVRNEALRQASSFTIDSTSPCWLSKAIDDLKALEIH